MARAKAIIRSGQPDEYARIVFSSVELMAKLLTPTRWAIIRALTGAGPIGVRELARRLERDVKGVHTDTQALVLGGVLDKTPDGKLEFPYDAVHVDFMVRAA